MFLWTALTGSWGEVHPRTSPALLGFSYGMTIEYPSDSSIFLLSNIIVVNCTVPIKFILKLNAYWLVKVLWKGHWKSLLIFFVWEIQPNCVKPVNYVDLDLNKYIESLSASLGDWNKATVACICKTTISNN